MSMIDIYQLFTSQLGQPENIWKNQESRKEQKFDAAKDWTLEQKIK